MKQYLLFFFSCFPIILYSQTHQPLNTLPSELGSMKDNYLERAKEDVASVKSDNANYNKALKGFYNRRVERIIKNIEREHYVFGEEVNTYLEGMLQEIQSKNPELTGKKIRLLLSRYTWPNATCLGEGTIVLNIGLISRLENEDQLAFVVCHELAHYYLDHLDVSVKERLAAIHSKEMEKEVRKIKKSEYSQTTRAEKLLKGLVYDGRRHGRLNESEADEYGCRFLAKTKYKTAAALSALEMLDVIDEDKYQADLKLNEIFNFDDYPFRSRWLEKEVSMLDHVKNEDANEDGWESDSLKTHPDCKERVLYLEDKFKLSKQEIEPGQTFLELVQLSDFAILESEYDFGNYGRSLYMTLQMMRYFPKNEYLKLNAVRNLVGICQAQQEHQFANFVEKPSKRQSKSYNQFLNFLQNLRLRELSLISYHYSNNLYNSIMEKNEEFYYKFTLAAHLAKMEEEKEKRLSQYIKIFGKEGKYYDYLTELE